jgi:hypothetical protein
MADHGLNLFQRLARRWDSVHPYNAAQVMRVAEAVNPDKAGQAWAEALRGMGLGRVYVADDLRFRHEALNGEFVRYPLSVLGNGMSVAGHLTRELNRAFDREDEPPFRPFLVSEEDGTYLGVVYQHWIADSVSIRAVLREWFVRLFDPAAARETPVKHPQGGYWKLFGNRGNWRVDATVLANFRSHMRHRRVRKVVSRGPQDYPVRVSLHDLSEGLPGRLREAARAERMKVHDILLAAVAEACDRHVPVQVRANRPDLSIGSVVDLRRHAAGDLSDTFGLFLGFTQVVCRPQILRDWPRLLQSVASQNRVNKESGLAQVSMFWMAAAMAVNRFVPDRDLYKFYRKELPMAGGLSNVNMNDTWATRYSPDILRNYWRVSPTGPLVPVVFSTTTLGGRMTLALTCRDSLMSEAESDAMADGVVRRLESVAGRGPAAEVTSSATA